MLTGIDVSHWNDPIDWPKVKAGGYRFAITKATEGRSYVDPSFVAHVDGARRVGLVAGAYHFARPGDGPASAQADRFLAVVTPELDDPLLLALDLEDDGGLTPRGLGNWAESFFDRVDYALEHVVPGTVRPRPLLYLPDYFAPQVDRARLGSRPLWLADVHDGDADVPAPWRGWTFWQYAASYRVPGVASRACDQDRFAGTHEELLMLAGDDLVEANPTPPARPPALPIQEDTVQLIRHDNSPTTYLTNGLTRRWIKSPAERDELVAAGICTSRVAVVDRKTLEAIVLVGPSPD